MSKWLNGRVIENRVWTETLFSLRVEAPKLAFEAGQFVRIALDLGGERIARPFSFVNPPADPVMEFYGVVVPEGPLSPSLARLQAGDALYIADNPAGFLVLSEVPAAEDLWLVATGHGHRAVPVDPAHRGALAALPAGDPGARRAPGQITVESFW